MRAIVDVLATAGEPRAGRLAAQRAFLRQREQIWLEIQAGRFPATYVSVNNRKYVGAPRRTAIRCDFLLASKMALGSKYATDRIADLAQRDLLFYVLRDREVFPHRTGNKFYSLGSCGHFNDHDLYSRIESSRLRCQKPTRWVIAALGSSLRYHAWF